MTNSSSSSGSARVIEHREDLPAAVREHHVRPTSRAGRARPQQRARRRTGTSGRRAARRSGRRSPRRPRAIVATDPSIPLAPRLPDTRSRSGAVQMRGGRRGAMNASRSRTGVEEPTHERGAVRARTRRRRERRVPRTVRPSASSSRSTAACAQEVRRHATRSPSSSGGRPVELVAAVPSQRGEQLRGRRRSAARRSPFGIRVEVVAIQHHERVGRAPRVVGWRASSASRRPAARPRDGGARASSSSPISSCPAASARPASGRRDAGRSSGSARTGQPRSAPSDSSDSVCGGAQRADRDHAAATRVARDEASSAVADRVRRRVRPRSVRRRASRSRPRSPRRRERAAPRSSS